MTNCEECVYYEYDPETDTNYCEADLDEDDMERFQILRHCRHLDSTGNRLHLFPVPSDVLLFVCLGHTIPILRRNSHIQTH